jgi:hypothetical protein
MSDAKGWTEGRMAKHQQLNGRRQFHAEGETLAEDLALFRRLAAEGRGTVRLEIVCNGTACREDCSIWMGPESERPEPAAIVCCCIDHDPNDAERSDEFDFVMDKKWIDELKIPGEPEILKQFLEALVGVTMGPRGMTAKRRAFHQLERLKASQDPEGEVVKPEALDPADDPEDRNPDDEDSDGPDYHADDEG